MRCSDVQKFPESIVSINLNSDTISVNDTLLLSIKYPKIFEGNSNVGFDLYSAYNLGGSGTLYNIFDTTIFFNNFVSSSAAFYIEVETGAFNQFYPASDRINFDEENDEYFELSIKLKPNFVGFFAFDYNSILIHKDGYTVSFGESGVELTPTNKVKCKQIFYDNPKSKYVNMGTGLPINTFDLYYNSAFFSYFSGVNVTYEAQKEFFNSNFVFFYVE